MTDRGGFGQIPFGQHEFGAGRSLIPPRFGGSTPLDGAVDVPRSKILEFEVYYYTDHPDETNEEVTADWIEISENGGSTWASAFEVPYTTTVRKGLAGHTMWIRIIKNGLWAPSSKIVIRTTQPDEFDQVITKDAPQVWPS
jgi:hypothetical protein